MAYFIFEEHDWDSEPSIFKLAMEDAFGSIWKNKTAEYLSWQGLKDSQEFANWKTQEAISVGYFNGIIGAIRNSANKNCN